MAHTDDTYAIDADTPDPPARSRTHRTPPPPLVRVGWIEAGPDTIHPFAIELEDWVAHDHAEMVDEFVSALMGSELIESVVQCDRCRMIVRPAPIDAEILRLLTQTWWQRLQPDAVVDIDVRLS